MDLSFSAIVFTGFAYCIRKEEAGPVAQLPIFDFKVFYSLEMFEIGSYNTAFVTNCYGCNRNIKIIYEFSFTFEIRFYFSKTLR
jgi:hypothetical protein